ncbi:MULTISPECIES: cytochrome P450 [unclassified Streptomyces]|uniref:cytochrome P450 n=1 Tax=unclassified Streptomyces TaxID=2593676 RepID=UPI000DBAD667|nr:MULTISPECIES: cytochrome P450 [unclassified Streptomyces]MYT68822.1 cytochrome P450 [Streptomyces sp. SID8367]RAJ86497.1 cytochrome P450 [Streptomyces sp. PsTaAH-137]
MYVRSARSAIASWLTRLYFSRLRRKGTGLDLSILSKLPDGALLPLRREGVDPVPEIGALRDREPVSRLPIPGMTVWLVSGYEEAKEVLGNAKAFSNDFRHLVGVGGAGEDQNPGGLGFCDPPDHTRLRRLLTPEFTMRRLSRLTPRIHAIVEEQLAQLEKAVRESPDGTADLVEHFAMPVPALVICELLGVPYEEREAFQQFSVARFDVLGGAGASFGAVSQSLDYLRGVVAQQRRDPGEGLLGMLVREHGDNITDEELTGLADGVLTGGLETTASMLALGTMIMLSDREHFAALRDAEDPAAVAAPFVDELLRHLTVVQTAFPRFAREDVEIGGLPISSGDIVIVSLSAADRDPRLGAEGDDMDAFLPSRPPTASHLAFGYGIHRCIGAELGKMELRAAFPQLVRRFPELQLAVAPGELEFRKLSIVYGVDSLPVRL